MPNRDDPETDVISDIGKLKDDVCGLAIIINDILNEIIAGDDQTSVNLAYLQGFMKEGICNTLLITPDKIPTIRDYYERKK